MIAKQDGISYALTGMAAVLSVYIMTYGGQYFFGGMVTLGMSLTGIVFGFKLKVQVDESDPEPEEVGNIGIFAMVALSVFIIFTYVLNLIYYTKRTESISILTFFGTFSFPTQISSSYTVGLLFIALIIPVAEEQFFRGFIGNSAVAYAGEGLGAVIGGFIFATFHLAAVGLNIPVLMSLAVDGMTIMAIGVISGRILTGIMAHIANNTISFLLQGSVLGVVLPPFVFPTMNAIIPVLFLLYCLKLNGSVKTNG